MNLTYFEKSFLLGISNPQEKKDKSIKKFNPYVVRLFHTLLQKVEMDPHRQWTHDLLRNYVNATYIFCIKLNKFFANKGQQKAINYYEGNSECLRVLFTGLYTPETYQGLKNGLYFVATRTDVNSQWDLSVMTRKDIVDERNNVTWKNELENIDHRDSFENELVSHEALRIKTIDKPKIMRAQDANKIIKEHNIKIKKVKKILQVIIDKDENLKQIFEEHNEFIKALLGRRIIDVAPKNKEEIADVLKDIEDKITGNSWLHILRDGIDNLPTDFVLSFFDKRYEVSNPVERYKNRKEWIEDCIEKSCSDNGGNSFKYYQEIMLETMQPFLDESIIQNLPAFFFLNVKELSQGKLEGDLEYNYLLPMYLQNSRKPDFCIVLRRKKNDNTYAWEPVTSLNMDEVYCDIRVLGKDAIERVHNWW